MTISEPQKFGSESTLTSSIDPVRRHFMPRRLARWLIQRVGAHGAVGQGAVSPHAGPAASKLAIVRAVR